MRKTAKCPYNIPFHRRHCLLAEFMKMLNENDFLYAIDSDVIAHNYEGDWQWNNEDIYDLIFFERFWNGEVVAGNGAFLTFPYFNPTWTRWEGLIICCALRDGPMNFKLLELFT